MVCYVEVKKKLKILENK